MSIIDPIAPDVTPETEQEWETRSQFRRDLLDRLDEALIAAEAWIEILRATEFAPLPAIAHDRGWPGGRRQGRHAQATGTTQTDLDGPVDEDDQDDDGDLLP